MRMQNLIRRALIKRDPKAAAELAVLLYGRGMDSESIYQFVNLRHPIDRANWEAMLRPTEQHKETIMHNNNPNEASHPDGRLVFGLLAARAILQKEAKKYGDKLGARHGSFADAACWGRYRDSYELADKLLGESIAQLTPVGVPEVPSC